MLTRLKQARQSFGSIADAAVTRRSNDVSSKRPSKDGLSIATDETGLETMWLTNCQDFCLLSDHPKKLRKHVIAGNRDELVRALKRSPALLESTDDCGKTLLHHAAANDHPEIIDLLINMGLSVDVKDNEGNTPLHLAVLEEKLKAIKALCRNDADSTTFNFDNLAPVHFACWHNRVNSLETLLQCRPQDIDLQAERGAYPVHVCCMKDSAEAFQLLLDHGARICGLDSTGLFPIHVAVQNLAVNVLRRLIRHAEQNANYTSRFVMNFKDKDGNVALHTAVSTGDERCVMLCLDHDADISVQQDDCSTPVHFACTKGELELLQLMQKRQPDEFLRVLSMKDSNASTPLHKAVLFNHAAVVRYIIDMGAEIEAKDDMHRTPLLLAAFVGIFEMCEMLTGLGADVTKVDVNGRNIFHLFVLAAGGSGRSNDLRKFETARSLINDRDIFGCTPLHYATKKGLVSSTHAFIELGADCLVQNNNQDTPLHFAARYGRINTCRKLLQDRKMSRGLNCPDARGYLPLHAAAANGHRSTVELLLDKGSIFQKSYGGNTVLHVAAKNGHLDVVEVLLKVNPSLLNAVNNNGWTALHLSADEGCHEVVQFLLTKGAELIFDGDKQSFITLAIRKRHMDVGRVVIAHTRWQEILLTSASSGSKCPVLGFIEEMPELAMLALDRCRWRVGDQTTRAGYVCYDFSILSGRNFDVSTSCKPLMPIKLMIANNRVDLLQHPVCTAYLKYKWVSYGCWIHGFNLFIYLVFIALLTYEVWTMDPLQNAYGPANMEYCRKETNQFMLPLILLTVMAGLNILKELSQLYQQKFRYFLDMTNYFEWALYISVEIFIIPKYFGYSYKYQQEAAAVAMLLAYTNLLLFFKRLEMLGIYVVMFIEITQTLMKALILFIILIIGFSFSFYILLDSPVSRMSAPNVTMCAATVSAECASALYAWHTPVLAILKTVMMMMGEFDYLSTFIATIKDDNDLTMHFTTLTFILLLVFIFLIPILLMNLLIGLAVGDIESVRKNATLKRIAMQVEWYAELEEKLPISVRRKIFSTQWREFPHCFFTNYCTINQKLWESVAEEKLNCAEDQEKTALAGGKDEDLETLSEPRMTDMSIQDASSQFTRQGQLLKDKLDKMDRQMFQQGELLKLIIQKMEIHTEADEQDEGSPLQPFAQNGSDEGTCRRDAERWRKLRNVSSLMSSLSRQRVTSAGSVKTKDNYSSLA